MIQVIRSPQAEVDLLEICDHIALSNVSAAGRMLDLFESTKNSLSEFPSSGTPRPELGVGIRSIPVYPYVVLYRDLEQRVEVVRIVHGARDLTGEIHDSLQ